MTYTNYTVQKPVVVNLQNIKNIDTVSQASFYVLRKFQLIKSGINFSTDTQAVAKFKRDFDNLYRGLSKIEIIKQCQIQTGYSIGKIVGLNRNNLKQVRELRAA